MVLVWSIIAITRSTNALFQFIFSEPTFEADKLKKIGMKILTLLVGVIVFSSSTKAQNQFYGMTRLGGANNLGTIFKTDANGANCTILKDLISTDGTQPQGALMQANDGKLYGLASAGGASFSYGTIFQFDPTTNIYTKKINFNSTNGDGPKGSLIQANDGKLYGMTFYGGTNDLGVIFQYDPTTNILIKKVDFSSTLGNSPAGSLIQATDGNIYGMTSVGGANNLGVLFQYNPITNTYSKKIDFAGTTNGSGPVGSLIQASDGKLYGMTKLGGTNNSGIIFQYDPITSIFNKKIDFTGTSGVAIGHMPTGSLMQAIDGKMYGVTGGYPVLFQYDFITNIYNYKTNLPPTPEGYLLQASNGNLYGTSIYGGANGKGTIYQYNYTSNTLTITTDFNTTTANFPTIALIELSGTVKVKEHEIQNDFKLFPNPTTSILNINLSNFKEENTSIIITNALGQVVFTERIRDENTSFNINNLNVGVYFVNVTDSKGNIVVKKIIKE